MSKIPQAGDAVSYAPVANCTYLGVAQSDPIQTDSGLDVINITISVALTDVEKWPHPVTKIPPKAA